MKCILPNLDKNELNSGMMVLCMNKKEGDEDEMIGKTWIEFGNEINK